MKKNELRIEYMTRDGILKLLSDREVESLSTAEGAPGLNHGDEYIDLEHLDQGVQRADGVIVPMGHVLPRKAVHEATWSKILTKLGPSPITPALH